MAHRLIANAALDSWDDVIETQLKAAFLLSKITAASMAKRRRGKMINIAGMYSYFDSGPVPSCSAAKGAIVQLTKSMAIELAPPASRPLGSGGSGRRRSVRGGGCGAAFAVDREPDRAAGDARQCSRLHDRARA